MAFVAAMALPPEWDWRNFIHRILICLLFVHSIIIF